MADTISAKELAKACDTTPKRMRAFIRSLDEKDALPEGVAPVGSGARYGFSRDEAHALIAAWGQRTRQRSDAPARSKDELIAWLSASDEGADDDA